MGPPKWEYLQTGGLSIKFIILTWAGKSGNTLDQTLVRMSLFSLGPAKVGILLGQGT